MSIPQSVAARSLVWLTALVMPLQVAAPVSCGCAAGEHANRDEAQKALGCCAGGKAPGKAAHACCQRRASSARCLCTGVEICRCGNASPCRRQAASCAKPRGAARGCGASYASAAAGLPECACGLSCRCGATEEPTPATPPVENTTSAEKIADAAASAASDVAVVEPQNTQCRCETPSETFTLAALDRCASLCRFTL